MINFDLYFMHSDVKFYNTLSVTSQLLQLLSVTSRPIKICPKGFMIHAKPSSSPALF